MMSQAGFSGLMSRMMNVRSRAVRAEERRQKRRSLARTEHSRMNAFMLEGPISIGHETAYAADGRDFVIEARTWIFGEIRIGARAKVYGEIGEDGGWYAKKIVITKAS